MPVCIVSEYPASLMTGGLQVQAEETCAALARLPGVQAELFNWSERRALPDLYHFIGLPEHMKLKLVEPLRDLFKDEVRALGFDERFIRMWDFYLAICEAAFLERHCGLYQALLVKNGSRQRHHEHEKRREQAHHRDERAEGDHRVARPSPQAEEADARNHPHRAERAEHARGGDPHGAQQTDIGARRQQRYRVSPVCRQDGRDPGPATCA